MEALRCYLQDSLASLRIPAGSVAYGCVRTLALC